MSMHLVMAHHALVSALPFVVPAVVLPAGLGVIALRDRRRERREARPHA